MKRQLFLVVAALFLAGPAQAQEATRSEVSPRVRGAGVADNYYMDRKSAARLAIQQRAAYKAAQRQRRIEGYKWYGYSPSRPPAGHAPFMGSAAPWLGPVIYYRYPGGGFPRTATLAR